MISRFAIPVRVGLGIVFLASAVLQNASAQDMNAAIDKAVKTYDTVKTARGTLTQTTFGNLGVYNLAADFQQQFPNLLSVRYTEPKGDVLVGDGKFIWMYSPSTDPKTVVKMTPGTGTGSINLIGLFLTSPREKYTLADSGRQTVEGKVTRAIGLVPKQPMPEFRRATVWIEEATGIIRQFEFTDQGGIVRRIKFVTLSTNVAVNASQFKFTVPSGVKVVEGK